MCELFVFLDLEYRIVANTNHQHEHQRTNPAYVGHPGTGNIEQELRTGPATTPPTQGPTKSMSDLANLVLAGLRDKVVEDLKEENEQLSTANTTLSKSLLLEAPSFARLEDSTGAVLTRSQQFPGQKRCDCCSWFPLNPGPDEGFPLMRFPGIRVYFGSSLDKPFAESKELKLHQVTGYCGQTHRTAIQFSDASIGFTLHTTIGPIPREEGKALFAKTPRDIGIFCEKLLALSSNATVRFVCISIVNEEAISLLTTKGKLSRAEAIGLLKITDEEDDEADDDIEPLSSDDEDNDSHEEAKGT